MRGRGAFGRGRAGPQVGGRFASTNRQQFRRRADDFISATEIEEIQTKGGEGFRVFFFVLIAALIVLLFWAKYDVEMNLEVPQIESGAGFGEVKGADTADTPSPTAQRASQEDLDMYYGILGVDGRMKGGTAGGADADKERRRENYRVRRELKKAFEKHIEDRGQLVHCGRACEAKNKQVEVAYDALSSQVDRELFQVLLDAKDTKTHRTTGAEDLRSAYEAKRKNIEESEEGDDRQMALEELKDAYDILVDPSARAYYLMTGRKPPVYMKHTSARAGGWGVELSLEFVVICGLVLLLLLRIPNIVRTTMRLKDRIEEQENLDSIDYERSKAEQH